MKIKMRHFVWIAAVAAVFAGIGCNTISTSATQYVGGPKFPPSDPAQVQILRTEPTRPHVRLGEVRAEPARESIDISKIEMALREKAAKMGADAAVVVVDRVQVTGAMVVGGFMNRAIDPIEGRVIVAVAIKYQ